MRPILETGFVCLSADCDAPEPPVEALTSHLAGEGTLPFVMYVNRRGEWIHGSSGYVDVDEILSDLERVLASPLLGVDEETERVMRRALPRAREAVEASRWREAMRHIGAAEGATGTSETKDALLALRDRVQASAREGEEAILFKVAARDFTGAAADCRTHATTYAGLASAEEVGRRWLAAIRAADRAWDAHEKGRDEDALQDLRELVAEWQDTMLGAAFEALADAVMDQDTPAPEEDGGEER